MLTALLGLISDVQRNLILQHANSGVFQHNYLSRYITQDTQAIYRGLAPQTAVIRAASGMARTIDQRRPRALNDDQLAEVCRKGASGHSMGPSPAHEGRSRTCSTGKPTDRFRAKRRR
jgi:hypothetical protein